MSTRTTSSSPTLRGALLRGLVPLVVLGLIATGLWSVVVTWYGALYGAEGWLGATATTAPYVVASVRDEALRRLVPLAEGDEPPRDEESVVPLSSSGAPTGTAMLPDPAFAPLLAELAPTHHARVVKVNHRLYAVAATEATEQGRTVVISDVTQTVANFFAEQLKAETVLYVDGLAVASTWRNVAGERVLNQPDEVLAKRLQHPETIESGAMSEGVYRTGGYAGYEPVAGLQHRGQDVVPVFRALYPLENLENEPIGVVGGMVPKDVMMAGPKKGMYGAAFFVLLTAAISIAVLVRVANKQLGPLTALTRRVRELRSKISERLPDVDIVERDEDASHNELGDLAHAFAQLEAVTDAAARMDEELAASRDRLQEQATELEKAHQAALEASRMKSEFLANMSHEIRTPMNGVIGMASVLSEMTLKPAQRQYVEAIRRSGEDLLSVINDILDFSKIEAGKLSLTRYRFHLRECIDDVLQLLADRAVERNLELACFVGEGVPTWVEGDPVRLRQVLVNLVGNGVKFTERGEVTVHVSRGPGDILEWEVRDTGIGISEDAREHLFEPFVQVDGSLNRPHSGTGLGLAISRQLVELMGGEIGVESEVGKGSRFFFSIPLPAVPAEADTTLPRHLLESKRVLVVDDRKLNRTVLRRQLIRVGMDVTEASDGERGLEALVHAHDRSEPFHLAVVDVNMRPVDGLQLRERIRDDPRFTRLPVLISASVGEPRINDLEESEIDAILTKPMRESLLYATTRRLLGVEDPGRVRVASPVPRSGQGTRVLVVEDQTINQEVAVALLQRLGLEAHVATSGEEALQLLRTHDDFDLVLMDCQMPGIDGFEATRRIREGDAGRVDIPIIAMTAQAMKGDREACITAGMNDYCPKPVTLEKLRDVLARCLADHDRVSSRPSAASPAADDGADPGPAIDPSVLEELGLGGEGGTELRDELYGMLAAQMPPELEALREATDAADWARVSEIAHAMKSACAQVGALRLSGHWKTIELRTREGDAIGPEAIAAIDREWTRVARAMSDAVGHAPGPGSV